MEQPRRMDGKKVNPAMLALIAEGFLMRLGFGIISFALPLYARHLGLNLTEVGALLAVTSVVKVALKPLTGWVADRVGAKRGLVVALALRSLVSFLFAFTSSPWQLFSIRGIHGISTSVRDPAINALIAENADEKAIGSAFAWYFTAKSLASSIGKAVAGALLVLTAYNYPAVFLITWGISSLTLPAVILFVPQARSRRAILEEEEALAAASPERASPAGEQAPQSLYSRVAAVAGLGFFISITASMIDRFYPILATEYAGMSAAQAGVVYLASAVVTMVAGPSFGWLSDRYGRRPTTAVRTIANAGSSLLYLLVPNSVGFTSGKLLDDGGRAGFRPAWGALKADISSVKKSQRAQMMGLMDVGDDAGDMAGPVAGGLLWDVWGVTGLLAARIALAGLTEVYAATVFWRRPKERTAGTARPPPSLRPAYGSLRPRCWFCRRRPCAVRAVANRNLSDPWSWQVQPVCSRCERLLNDAGQQGVVREVTYERPWSGAPPTFAQTPNQQTLPHRAATHPAEVPTEETAIPIGQAKWRGRNGGAKG
jgi:MFS family permease